MINDGLYGILKGKKFVEYLGVYYQEEVGEEDVPEETYDINKTQRRIITYKEV